MVVKQSLLNYEMEIENGKSLATEPVKNKVPVFTP